MATTDTPAAPRTHLLVVWRMLYLLVQGGSSVAVVAIVAATSPGSTASAFLVAQGTVVAIQTIADLGVSQAAATWLAEARARRPDRADELTGALLAGAVRTALLATVAVALSGIFFLGEDHVAATLVLCAPLAGCALVIAALDGSLRAAGDIRTPVVLATCSRLGLLIGVGIGVAVSDRPEVIAAAASAATLLLTAPALLRIRRAKGDRATWIAHRREVIAACVPIGASQLAVVLTARITTPIAGALAGLLVAGAFEIAWRLFQIGQYVLGGPLTALAPKIAQEHAAGQRSTLIRALAAATGAGAVCVPLGWFLAPTVARLIAGDLADPTTDALRTLTFATPFALLALPASFALAARGSRDRWTLAWASGVGAVANVVLTVLITTTGFNAAVGPAVGCILTGVVLTAAALRVRSPAAAVPA